MLIEITRKCNENCTHCMVNACPTGKHMDPTIFIKSVKFAVDNKIKIINISGGDPFLHPDFFKWMRHLLNEIKNTDSGIALQSNGWWIEDEKLCSRIKTLMDNPRVLFMQVSTNKLYYPNYEWTMSHKSDYEKLHHKISFSADWQGNSTRLAYMGRAKNFMTENDIKGYPQCMNYVQYALNLVRANGYLPNPLRSTCDVGFMREHTCSPYIDVNGYLKLGEGDCCKPIFNMKDYIGTSQSTIIFNNIKNFIPCNACKCMKNYTATQRSQLNLLRALNGLPDFEF